MVTNPVTSFRRATNCKAEGWEGQGDQTDPEKRLFLDLSPDLSPEGGVNG
jgi:hypothetical protein